MIFNKKAKIFSLNAPELIAGALLYCHSAFPTAKYYPMA